MPVKFP
jgi:vacuolar protein-sorting-associated protein 4